MLDKLYIHKIQVKRSLESNQNGLGEFNKTTSVVYTDIPARVEEYNEKTQYRKSNTRMVNSTIIYIDPQYEIYLKDEIVGDYGHSFGIVSGINPALGPDGSVDHNEVIIENP